MGVDIGIAAGGAIHVHPWGSKAGAISMRQAIDAVLKGVSLEEYGTSAPELRAAIEAYEKGALAIMLGL